MQQRSDRFTFNRVGTTGCEVRGPDGLVIAWTVNEVWASVLVHLLNNSRCTSVGAAVGHPEAACCCDGPNNQKEHIRLRKERMTKIQTEQEQVAPEIMVAQAAIEYLETHGLVLTAQFMEDDPPSGEVAALLADYVNEAADNYSEEAEQYIIDMIQADVLDDCDESAYEQLVAIEDGTTQKALLRDVQHEPNKISKEADVEPVSGIENIVANESPMTKPYRITLRSVVKVNVEVDATSVREARGKVFSWTGDYPKGFTTVGDYYVDNVPLHDEGEMYWEIIAVDNEDFLEIVELKQDDQGVSADGASGDAELPIG
jgi:hypothetical protein